MLISLKFNNAFVFFQKTEFSLRADMRSKRLSSNVISSNDHSILKTACIYGANNSGKTCLVRYPACNLGRAIKQANKYFS